MLNRLTRKARRVLKRQTKSQLLAQGLLATGAGLLVVRAANAGEVLLALALIPLTLVGAYALQKLGAVSVAVNRRRRAELLRDSGRTLGLGERQQQNLRMIGVYTPVPAASRRQPGRMAAAALSDPQRPFRLFAATGGLGQQLDPPRARRRIAVIGPPETADALAERYAVVRLHPSVVLAELENHCPASLVIDGRATQSGPWSGALEARGAAMLHEILEGIAWLKQHGASVLYLPPPGARPVGGPIIADRSSLVIGGDLELELEHGEHGEDLIARLMRLTHVGEDR